MTRRGILGAVVALAAQRLLPALPARKLLGPAGPKFDSAAVLSQIEGMKRRLLARQIQQRLNELAQPYLNCAYSYISEDLVLTLELAYLHPVIVHEISFEMKIG